MSSQVVMERLKPITRYRHLLPPVTLTVYRYQVCTANQIVSYVWGFSNEGDTSLIKAHIRHVRQKVEPDPNKPSYILTVPGVGYSLVHHPVEEGRAKEVIQTLRVVSG